MNTPRKKYIEAKESLIDLNFILEHSDTELPTRSTSKGEYSLCRSGVKEFGNIEIIFFEAKSIKNNPAKYHIVLDAQGNFKSKMKSMKVGHPEICSDQEALEVIEDTVSAFTDLLNTNAVDSEAETEGSLSLIDEARTKTRTRHGQNLLN